MTTIQKICICRSCRNLGCSTKFVTQFSVTSSEGRRRDTLYIREQVIMSLSDARVSCSQCHSPVDFYQINTNMQHAILLISVYRNDHIH